MRYADIIETNQRAEWDQPVDSIEGAIPEDIDGTALRNGPGILDLGNDRLAYFDGLAALGGMQLSGGRAHFRSRFLRTDLFERETAAKAVLERRVFTNISRRWANLGNVRLGNSASHDVYTFGGGLYVGDAQHLEIDPLTFDVKDEVTWNGMVDAKHIAGPMPRADHALGRLLGYTLAQGPKQITTFFELDRSGKRVARQTAVIRGLIHDLAFTSNYYVVADNPAQLSVASALWGKSTVYGALRFHDGPVTLVLAERASGAVQKVALPKTVRALAHFLNAFEPGDGTIIVDAVGYEAPVTFDSIQPASRRGRSFRPQPTPRIVRYVIRRDKWRCEETHLAGAHGEAPEVDERYHGRPYRYAWFVTVPGESDYDPMTYFVGNTITCLDVEDETQDHWKCDSGKVVSQPAFIPRAGSDDEGDGYLAVWVTDIAGEGAEMVLLDARAPSKGPIATLSLPGYMPPPSHTRFGAGLRIAPEILPASP